MQEKFENGILGLIPQEEWLEVGAIDVTRPNDPVDALFTDTKTDNITARWQSLAYEYQIPVMAQFHAFDTESQQTLRVPIDNHNIEKGLIKVKINQSERMRTLLRSGVVKDDLYEYVINDGARLADQVVTRTKVAKNELMATGQVTINENNLNLTVDYGVPAAQTALTLDLGASEDIIGQIDEIIQTAQAAGVTITGMMTSSQNIAKMRKNAGMQTAVNGGIGAGQYIRQSALTAFMNDEFGINQIVTNDQIYSEPLEIDATTGRPLVTSHRYFPLDKVTFFGTNPAGKLGTGLWGDPPEVDDFEARVTGSGVSPYVYITQYFEKDPHVLWTKASALFIPVLYNPNSLFIASVGGEEGETGATGATGATGE